MILENVFTFVFRAAVYGQLFVWLWLYDQDWLNKFFKTSFVEHFVFMTLGYFAILVTAFNFSVGQYSTYVILNYLLLYAVAFWVYNKRFDWVQALSLMGLTVFFNSYYWESILHLTEINAILFGGAGFNYNILLQLVRLVPAWFFVKRFEFDKVETIDDLVKGLLLSFIIAFFSIRYLRPMSAYRFLAVELVEPVKLTLFALNRFICLKILIGVVFNAKKKEK